MREDNMNKFFADTWLGAELLSTIRGDEHVV